MSTGKEKDFEVRCRFCHGHRYRVPQFQKLAPCPSCGIKWRLRWLDANTPLIVGMQSWSEWEARMRREIDAAAEETK